MLKRIWTEQWWLFLALSYWSSYWYLIWTGKDQATCRDLYSLWIFHLHLTDWLGITYTLRRVRSELLCRISPPPPPKKKETTNVIISLWSSHILRLGFLLCISTVLGSYPTNSLVRCVQLHEKLSFQISMGMQKRQKGTAVKRSI